MNMKMIKAKHSCVLLVLLIPLIGALLVTQSLQAQNTDPQQKLSKGFMDSATSALVNIHSVKQNILNIVQNNLPSGYYDPKLAMSAYEQVRQAQIAATTNGDQQAAAQLGTYFQQVKSWAEKYKEARQDMDATDTMNRDDITEDPQLQSIDACEKGLNNMLISRVYTNVDSCQ
jgi:hypothetical protein